MTTMMPSDWLDTLIPAQQPVADPVSDHLIRGHYEDEQGLWTRGDLDLTKLADMTWADAGGGGAATFRHTSTGLLVTCEHGAYRFFPDAGELARIGMAGWVDRI